MTKLSLLLGGLLLLGCGNATTPRATSTTPPAPTATAAGMRVSIAAYGLSAVFPGVPKLYTVLKDETRSEQLRHEDTKHSFSLAAVSTMGRDRPDDAEWFDAMRVRMKLEKLQDLRLGAFKGQELGGTLDGKQVLARVYAVADTLMIAEVGGNNGKLDEAVARRFFDSLELELPWRIYASPTTKFSVMVPAHAVEVDKTEAGSDSRSVARAFFVGGPDQRMYWTTAQEIVDRNPSVSDDQILDAGLAGMHEHGASITWQAPLQASEARGREFVGSSNGMAMMGRIWLTEHFIYLLMVTATSRDALQQMETSRFYGSLVWY